MSDPPSSQPPDPAAEDAAREPLDGNRLARLRELQVATGYDFLSEVIQLFCTDTPIRLDALRAALAARDATKAEQVAHSLKGSSSNLGACVMEELARAIEHRAAAGAFDDVDELFARLTAEFDRVRAALELELERGRGPDHLDGNDSSAGK